MGAKKSKKSKLPKIPKHLTVFGQKITVSIVDKLGEIRGAHGLFIPKTNQIMIDLDTCEDKELMMITMIHETFHAHVDRLSLKGTGLTDEMEELMADTFAKTLVENFNIGFKK